MIITFFAETICDDVYSLTVTRFEVLRKATAWVDRNRSLKLKMEKYAFFETVGCVNRNFFLKRKK